MKKILIILALLFLISPAFAKTVQCVKKYQVFYENGARNGETVDVTPQIQYMLAVGWKVVSITPVSKRKFDSNPTDCGAFQVRKEKIGDVVDIEWSDGVSGFVLKDILDFINKHGSITKSELMGFTY